MTLREDGSDELVDLADGPTAPRLTTRAMAYLRRPRTPRWWQEILFIGVSYALYSTVRNAVPSHKVAAYHRAAAMLRFENEWHIAPEHWLNKVVASAPWLAYVSSYWYAFLHFAVAMGVLLWLYVRHPLRYRSLRSVVYNTTLVALCGFWFYALAPPRFLPGFVDTVDKYPTLWGSWDTAGVVKVSNQLAAMPSLHMAWSLWAGRVIFKLAEHRTTRLLGLAYPLITLLVILGTANHFLLDAVGGAAALGVGRVIERVFFGRPAFAPAAELRRAAAAPG